MINQFLAVMNRRLNYKTRVELPEYNLVVELSHEHLQGV